MTLDTIQKKNADKKHSVQRIYNGDVQFAEIYFTETDSLDYVVMYFDYNLNNSSEIENKIAKYRKDGGTIIIGCAQNTDCSSFKTLFDIYLDGACECDFENLIDFCISSQNSFVHISQHDFRSQPGTRVFVVSEKAKSVEILIEKLKKSIQKIMEQNSMKKIPKVISSFMTNGYELSISEVDEVIKSISRYLTEDSQCMLNLCQSMKKLAENEIKDTMIFFENRTVPVSCKG